MPQRGPARSRAGASSLPAEAVTPDLAAMAREHAARALRTLAEIAGDAEASDAARISAANALLDRGFGKSGQAIPAGEAEAPAAAPVVIQIIGVPARHDDDNPADRNDPADPLGRGNPGAHGPGQPA